MLPKSTNPLIDKFGIETVKQLKDNLQKNGSKATGNLMKSINYRYQNKVDKLIVDFVSDDYGQFVNDGRKKGKFAPVSKLMAWAKIKGIPTKSVFAINRKIYKFGIKPKPWLNIALSKNTDNLMTEIVKEYEDEIVSDVKKELIVKNK